jgi:N-acetylneuraminic acid mutarotase
MTLHRAFWTGTEMLVFGGIPGTDDGNYDSGLYNPTTDTWRHPSIQGQPSQRDHLSATWDGTEMIVYGGGQGSHFFNDAYAYHPGKDQWRTLTSAPVSRRSHASIFSSGLMYVWGGHSIDGTTLTYENSGYLYNTANNSWEKLTETSAPALNFESSLVATSNGFIAWGGQGNNQGGIYNNITKSWTSISTQDAPSGRSMSAIAWTGCKLMIWGGPKVDGAIYTP